MALKDALVWEEAQAIASAKEVFASTIATRREAVMTKGRSETNKGWQA
jgi:hypothetical protein